MATACVTPSVDGLVSLLEMVFGEPPEVSELEDAETAGWYGASFITDDDVLISGCVCDPKFVAYSGAALSMIPGDVVDEMLAENDLSKSIVDNFYEIMNICSTLLMSDNSEHLRLDKTFEPSDVAAALEPIMSEGDTCFFAVDVPKYGKGTIGFVLT